MSDRDTERLLDDLLADMAAGEAAPAPPPPPTVAELLAAEPARVPHEDTGGPWLDGLGAPRTFVDGSPATPTTDALVAFARSTLTQPRRFGVRGRRRRL